MDNNTTIDINNITLPDMTGRRVVIPGGTGSVGEGVVRAWIRSGADVIVPTRGQAKQQALRAVLEDEGEEALARLRFIEGEYTSFASAEQMAERITSEFGSVSDVVASIGGWWQGTALWDVSEADFQRYFVDLVTAHVATVKAWIPRLPAEGSYQLILGGSAKTPVPGSAIINMEQAALAMMRQVLSAEVGDQRRIVAQMLGPVQSRTRPWVDPSWITNVQVGEISVGIAHSDVTGVTFEPRTAETIAAAFQTVRLQ